ncbi:hypothetical protein [Candidatus Methylomirabilis sp.]|uniref:hypothetical protein n=1 Tax=Candidatus Methylomirabilis sp. TaxID=2032687 RepID=UPI00307618B2
MPPRMRPLVNFDPEYYTYPISLSRGSWARYPLEEGLSPEERRRRAEWLDHVHALANTNFHRHVLSRYGALADYSLFAGTLQRHGLFAERFFHRAVRHQVLGDMIADPQELHNLKVLLDEAWGYNTPFSRSGNTDVFFVVDHLFEQHLYAAIADREEHDVLLAWYERYSSQRRCEICGSVYRLIDLPDWAYAGSNGTLLCCMRCLIVERPSKKALLPHLVTFVQESAFIPSADAGPLTHSFTCRLAPDHWPAIFTAYGRMGGLDNVKAKWKSWFKALAASGVLPDGVLATSRGVRCLARDGHECHSLDEQQVDDWLTAHNVPHDREPPYPEHPLLNPRGRRRADWLVGDVFVEYFGLSGEQTYDRKTDDKVMLARELGIDMLPIYPSDMMSLDSKLGPFLSGAR